jgi:GNAT superfamily N-acetyltransferase
VRSREQPSEAEFAVVVADDWQGRGLGTTLLRYLAARARAEGIEHFTGLVLAENEPMLHMLEQLGDIERRRAEYGAIEVALAIPEDPHDAEHEQRLAGWMRAAASGELDSRLRHARR